MTLLHIDCGKCDMCRHDESSPRGFFIQIELFGFVFEMSFGR